MGQINAVILQGWLGKDPVLSETSKGKPMVSFDLASSQYANKPPTWVPCLSYDRHATIIHNLGLKKGDLITIRGYLGNTAKNPCGQRHVLVLAVECYLLKRKKGSGRPEDIPGEDEAPI